MIKQPNNAINAKGVQDIPEQSEGFIFNHTMLRIKDPVESLAFYTKILGMTLLRHRQFPDDEFDLYFLAKLTEDERNHLPSGQALDNYVSYQRGILELTHNGNTEPKGFGHICFSVPNLQEAVAWFDKNNVPFQKRPEDGQMREIAFIKDPDGYWIEIIEIS